MKHTTKVCRGCRHWQMQNPQHYGAVLGRCVQTRDINNTHGEGIDVTRAYGEDEEYYMARVLTGPYFGCIHWEKFKRDRTSVATSITTP